MDAGDVFVHRFWSFELFSARFADAAFLLVNVQTMREQRLFPRERLAAQGAQMLDALVKGSHVGLHRVFRFVHFGAIFIIAGKISPCCG